MRKSKNECITNHEILQSLTEIKEAIRLALKLAALKNDISAIEAIINSTDSEIDLATLHDVTENFHKHTQKYTD